MRMVFKLHEEDMERLSHPRLKLCKSKRYLWKKSFSLRNIEKKGIFISRCTAKAYSLVHMNYNSMGLIPNLPVPIVDNRNEMNKIKQDI